jgi:tetratricopeptide (TPR) repeat protein
MKKFLIVIAVFAALVMGLFGLLGYGDQSIVRQNLDTCGDGDGRRQLAACTWLLENYTSDNDEDLASIFLNRGNAHSDIRDYDNALTDYAEAESLDPGEFKTYYNRAFVYRWQGRYDLALKDHDSAIALYADHPWLFEERAKTLYEAGRYEESLPDLEKALEFEPDDAAVLNSMAWTLLTLGRVNESLPFAERSLENDNETATGSLDTYAHIMAELGRVEEAVAYFEKAARIGGSRYIRQIQAALESKGLFEGIPNGVMDLRTKGAIRDCATSNCRLLIEPGPSSTE